MPLKRITDSDGSVHFVDSKTGAKVNVDLKHTTGSPHPVISCPKCSAMVKRGSFRTWQILLSIFLFPIGLLALISGREPSKCQKCGYTWVA